MSELTKCNHDYCYHEYIGLAGVKCLKCENKQLKEHLAAAHEALADWKRIADAETDRRAEWERVARSRPMVIDNQEAGLEIERLRVRLAAAEAAARWLWPKVSDDAYDAAWEEWPWLDSEAAKGRRDE